MFYVQESAKPGASTDRTPGATAPKIYNQGQPGQRQLNDRRNRKASSVVPHSCSTGLTEELKRSIYDTGISSQADQFVLTTKDIASCAGRTCTDPQDIRVALENLDDTLISVPVKRPTVKAMTEEIAVLLISKDVDLLVKQEQYHHENKAKMYSVVLGQCTEAMKNCLEEDSTYDDM